MNYCILLQFYLLMTINKTKIPLKFKIKINTTCTNENPCLILLHGYGSNEDDLFSLADYFPDDYIIISLRAPITLPMGGYAWSNINSNLINEYTILQEAKNSIKLIYESIQILTDKYNINKKDVSSALNNIKVDWINDFSAQALATSTLSNDDLIEVNKGGKYVCNMENKN